jgi:hypothetical protein
LQEDVTRSRKAYRQFFRLYIKMYSRRVASYKAHIGNHLCEDIEKTGVHLEALAAYPFENDVRFITQV